MKIILFILSLIVLFKLGESLMNLLGPFVVGIFSVIGALVVTNIIL